MRPLWNYRRTHSVIPDTVKRGSGSYFSNYDAGDNEARVCIGTSCHLAGAQDTRPRLPAHLPQRNAYCLGYCYRSRAILTAGSPPVIQTFSDFGQCTDPDSDPAIRAHAAEAIVTRRIARGDFSGLTEARADGVYGALARVLGEAPDRVLSEMEASGERGRGGAGFPTGQKWRACATAKSGKKYVVANGDEGDPGSFIDRVLIERDPHTILEGLLICGYAIGAQHGLVYIRAEYPDAQQRMSRAIEEARAAGVVGQSVLGSGFSFDLQMVSGKGSYVCGEETALLNALEGLRGEVRVRPPYPTEEGLFGHPTLIQNVETLVNVPWIIGHGANAYAELGTRTSNGTKAICLNHGFARPGIVEVEFGTSLREVIEGIGGGGRDATNLEAVMLGGPMGSLLLPAEWDVPICFDAMAAQGIRLGHGGLVALPVGTDFHALLVHMLRFMVDESCGKCVPCRLGPTAALKLIESDGVTDRLRVDRILELMEAGSLCAFGQLMPDPMQKMLRCFGDRIFEDEA